MAGDKVFKVTRSEEMNPAGNNPEVHFVAGKDIELHVKEEAGVRQVTIDAAGNGRGETGADGAPGKDGADGLRGDRGLQGERGSTGDRGAQGEQGIRGIPGPQGVEGKRGERGEQGIQGPKGNRGEPGQNGFSGAQGHPGASGADATAPTGGIIGFVGSVAPDGYLLTDGTEYQRVEFSSLAALFPGTDSTFTVPNIPGSIIKH